MKKIHGNQKYDIEILKQAVALYKKGKHSLRDVCEEFKITSVTSLRYHLSKKNKRAIKDSHRRWRESNLEENREKMREYARSKRI
jgi:transposase-like protein